MTTKTARKTRKWHSDPGTFSIWLCLPTGPLAISHRWPDSYDPATDERDIQVRARRREYLDRLRSGFLPALGPDVGLTAHGTDYGHRAFCTAEQLARAMARMALSIDATGFKDHAVSNDLHAVYSSMWSAMLKLDDGTSPYGWPRDGHRPWLCRQYQSHWWLPQQGTGQCRDCGARRTLLANGRYRHSYPKGSVRLPVPKEVTGHDQVA